MKQFDIKNLLIDRSKMFEKHFGKVGEYNEGKVDFPSAKGNCAISYTCKSTFMSKNYFLSLQTEVAKAPSEGSKKSCCYLNRLGNWKVKGNDSKLDSLCSSLRDSNEIKELLKETDLDSINIFSEGETFKLNVNLYGGGYAAMMLPPMKINIKIPEKQISPSAKLFKSISREINKVA